MYSKPLVSIICLVYNHEKFLKKALNGFLMQKVDFSFEVIVHDDASTDGSTNILLEFKEKYPNIIKPIIQKTNQYSKEFGSVTKIVLGAATGKYIALCEGDDYWTDAYKLQKQINFLESNSEYSLCFHNAIVENVHTGKTGLFENIEERSYSGHEILKKWTIPTASVVFRNDYNKYIDAINPKYKLGLDTVLFLHIAETGKIWAMKECMCVYRIHEDGMSFKKRTIEHQNRAIIHYSEIGKNFSGKYKSIAQKMVSLAYLRLSIRQLESKQILDSFSSFSRSFILDPFALLNNIKRKVINNLCL